MRPKLHNTNPPRTPPSRLKKRVPETGAKCPTSKSSSICCGKSCGCGALGPTTYLALCIPLIIYLVQFAGIRPDYRDACISTTQQPRLSKHYIYILGTVRAQLVGIIGRQCSKSNTVAGILEFEYELQSRFLGFGNVDFKTRIPKSSLPSW